MKAIEQFNGFMKRNGFKAHTIPMSINFPCSSRDAEWNYSDVPHFQFIHKGATATNISIDKHIISSLFIQKIFFLTVPLQIVNTHEDRESHFYYTNAFGLWLSIYTTYEDNQKGCTIRTQYTLWYKYFFQKPFLYIASLALKKNYKRLNQEDGIMRQQRGNLRKDPNLLFLQDKNNIIGFNDTVDIYKSNIRLLDFENISEKLSISSLKDKKYLELESYYLAIVLTGTNIKVWPTICEHEGACLVKEGSQLNNNHESTKLLESCPWHGKSNRVLASFKLSDLENEQTFKHLCCNFRVRLTTEYLIFEKNN